MVVSRTVLLSAVVFLLSACSSSTLTGMIKPFRIDARQGNYVTQEMLSQLAPGMTREQVRFILGSPLLVDVFHADRWDYVYRLSAGYAEPQQRAISVFFVDGKLSRVGGDVVGASGEHTETPLTLRVIDITGSASAPVAAKP